MWTVVPLLAGLALSGCDSPSSEGGEELPAKDLCAMVTADQVTKLLDITIEEVSPLDSGAKTIDASSCVYEAADEQPLAQVSTIVETVAPELAGQKALDVMFSSIDGKEKQDYDSVDDLGQAAGFGPSLRAAPELAEYVLGVVDGRHTVRVLAEMPEDDKTEVTVDQLRPIAEEILKEWERG